MQMAAASEIGDLARYGITQVAWYAIPVGHTILERVRRWFIAEDGNASLIRNTSSAAAKGGPKDCTPRRAHDAQVSEAVHGLLCSLGAEDPGMSKTP